MSRVEEALDEKRRYVLAEKNKRVPLPILGWVTIWLLLDRIGIPAWAWGVYWTFVVLVTVTVAYHVWTTEYVQRTPVWREDLPERRS